MPQKGEESANTDSFQHTMMSVIRCKTLLQTETILVNQGGSGTIVCPVMNFGLLAGGLAKITTLILIPKGLLWPDYQPTPSLSQHHISDTPFTTPFTRVVIYIYIYKSSSQTPAPRVDSDPRHDRSGTAIRLPISRGGVWGVNVSYIPYVECLGNGTVQMVVERVVPRPEVYGLQVSSTWPLIFLRRHLSISFSPCCVSVCISLQTEGEHI